MKKSLYLIAIISIILSSNLLIAQDSNINRDSKTLDSIALAHQWKPSGILRANISQVFLKDWVQGGDNSVAWNISVELGLDKDWENWKLKNKLKSIYGMMKLGDKSFRGNENELYIDNLLAYKLKWKMDPFFSNSIRTVMVDAYKFTDSTAEQVSTFFDPGYITQSLGFLFDNSNGFTARLGIALQESFVNKFRHYLNKGDKNGPETFNIETGIELVSTLKMKIMDNVLYDGSLRLFSRFKSMDVWDVRWDNTIAAQINKYINVNFTAIIIHEVAQTRRTQLKQGLQIGFNYFLF